MNTPSKISDLKKGELFRVIGPRGVAPDIWVYEGKTKDGDGFLIRRASDNFSIVLGSKDVVIPLPPIEDL